MTRITTPENTILLLKPYIVPIDVLLLIGMDVIHELGLRIDFHSNCLTEKQQICKLPIEFKHGHTSIKNY